MGKHTNEDCEDGILVTPDFVAVIDGSTSKSPSQLHPTMKNGRYCMILISMLLKEQPAELSLTEFCTVVTHFIHSFYPKDDSRYIANPQERLCASAAIFSSKHREIWLIGDCQCMVNGEITENSKPYEFSMAKKRSDIFDEECARHPDMILNNRIHHDYARDTILPQLINSMKYQNKTYAVIDGYPIYKEGIKIVPVKETPSEVVLATDGYPYLFPTLEESEYTLREQIASDPFNIRTFIATKGVMTGNCSFDDRAYIRFRTD